MNILGISCYYHDAAAALISSGKVLAAAEEERFSRKKHDSGFPKNAIDFCLRQSSLTIDNIDYIVFYEKPFRKFHRILLSSLSTYPRSYSSFREAIRIWMTQKLWIKSEIAAYLKCDLNKILFCEHHLSHAASCFFPSPFPKAAILTVDGVGEWTTTSFGVGEGNNITLQKEIHFPQSLGLLYSAFTAFLGFEVNEGEWKVMGLAPYGKPQYTDKIWKTVKKNSDGSFSLDFSYFSFHYSDKYSFSQKLVQLLGEPIDPKLSYMVTQRSSDIAASIQIVTEELLLNMVKAIKRQTQMENLCMAGGVALNSVANYRLLKESGFQNIFIQPAAGDSGGALGAALYVYHHILGNKNRHLLDSAYLGQQFHNEAIEQFLKTESGKNTPDGGEAATSTPPRWRKLNNDQLISYVVDNLCQGKVIGWMQGRFEWGPRALGARSILADARRADMKEIINAKVKFREAFRPFAPSIIAEYADKVFDLNIFAKQDNKTPRGWQADPEPVEGEAMTPPMVKESEKHYPLRFMLYIVPVRKEWRQKVPAINHADNTARPQLVYEKTNPLYYRLIKTFYKKTGVPLILNTSFNLKGEPIVSSPADAYSTFIRSGIDILVMGNYVCEK